MIILSLDICKITCGSRRYKVKIEVNQTKRGLVCGEAALSRQHAHDLFDVKQMDIPLA